MKDTGKSLMMLDELLKMHPDLSDDIERLKSDIQEGSPQDHEEPDGDEGGAELDIDIEGGEPEEEEPDGDEGPGFSFKDTAMGKKRKIIMPSR